MMPQPFEPSEEEIRAATAAIRAEWSEEEHIRRAAALAPVPWVVPGSDRGGVSIDKGE